MVISLNVYLAILVALAGERLFEFAVSRRNARRALAAGAVEVAQGQYTLIATFHALFIFQEHCLSTSNRGVTREGTAV